jgi:type II secretory pathway component GspD/PulD (secretin)
MRTTHTSRIRSIGLVAILALTAACASTSAFKQGQLAVAAGNLDQAVAHFRAAAQADPDNADYQMALQRAMLAASRAHLDRARTLEEQGQFDAARDEYTRATEYDPTNRVAAEKARDLDRGIRAKIDADRPRPFQDLQQRARASSPVPLLNPASRDPITLNVANTPIRDVLTAIANNSGIDVLFDRDAEQQVLPRPISVDIQGLTLEQALNYLMSANQLSYKVISARTILVFQDIANKHLQYDDQVIQTFPIAHADPAQLVGVIMAIVRIQGLGVQPLVQANPQTGTIVAKATVPIMEIIAKVIEQNDKPPAEVVIDVEILEVNRARAKQYGLELSNYALGAIYSPDSPPEGLVQPPVSLQTFRDGVSASDFYLTVPTAVVRALATDQRTKLLAKPQLRGAEGQKMSLRLGEEIPVPSTTFTPVATGGVGQNPLTTFQYRPVGVIMDITPRVTLDNDIILDVAIDNSARGQDVLVNGVTAPSFTTRSVAARFRLRDGESNLIAGLLREEERKSVRGFPGAINVPVLRQLFSANDNATTQTDIVMLLTPRIIRGKEITEADLQPVYIGSGQNFGLNGPPPLIALPGTLPDLAELSPAGQPAPATAAAASTPPAVATPPRPAAAPVPLTPVPVLPNPAAGGPPAGVALTPPPGSTPVPGFVPAPAPPATAPAAPVPPLAPAPVASTPPAAASAPKPASLPPAVPAPASAPVTPVPAPAPGASMPVNTRTIGPNASGTHVELTPSGTFRVGGGPYTVPIMVTNATRLSSISLTVTFDATRLRVRNVQEGSFMRTGGVNATFTQQSNPGRIDLTIVRMGDTTGAAGAGVLGAIQLEPLMPGATPLSISGVASGPGGAPVSLNLKSATMNVEQ